MNEFKSVIKRILMNSPKESLINIIFRLAENEKSELKITPCPIEVKAEKLIRKKRGWPKGKKRKA